MRGRALVVGLAAWLLIGGCSGGPPPLADAALPSGDGGDDLRAVYVAPAADDCAGSYLSGVAAFGDRLVLSENTCAPEAGGDDSTPHFRLIEAAPSGVQELRLPESVSARDGIAVLAASENGDVFVRSTDDDLVTSLWRRSSDGTWSLLTRPSPLGGGHAGDGGPARDALLSDPQAISLGPDGSLYVLEPNAVRHIGLDGVITTVAGSDRLDPPDPASGLAWGSAGVYNQRPDPRPLPPGPVVATDFPLPRLTALDVAEDGTVWLASHDAVLRLGTDGLIVVHADASTVVPDGPASALVGARGSSSSITDLEVAGDSLLLLDQWSSSLLRLAGQRLSLVLGDALTEPTSCSALELGAVTSPERVCPARYIQTKSGDRFVVHFSAILSVPPRLFA